MANSAKCERCGANLDFGERCTCNGKNVNHQSSDNRQYYRKYPEYSTEQKLDALHDIMALIV